MRWLRLSEWSIAGRRDSKAPHSDPIQERRNRETHFMHFKLLVESTMRNRNFTSSNYIAVVKK